MGNHDLTIKQILNENKGFITVAQVTKARIPRRCLTEMTAAGSIYKVDRGIYALPEAWEDEMFFLQYRFSKGIFSHDTALYLHSMTDRTPRNYIMTFPRGYNTGNAKSQKLVTKLVVSKLYEIGITEIVSPCQNVLRVYDIERTLCDIVKGNATCDIQIVNQAMKTYAGSKNKDIAKLIGYAEQLRVKSKILTYMEVLL